jgi:hypothetical protein
MCTCAVWASVGTRYLKAEYFLPQATRKQFGGIDVIIMKASLDIDRQEIFADSEAAGIGNIYFQPIAVIQQNDQRLVDYYATREAIVIGVEPLVIIVSQRVRGQVISVPYSLDIGNSFPVYIKGIKSITNFLGRL